MKKIVCLLLTCALILSGITTLAEEQPLTPSYFCFAIGDGLLWKVRKEEITCEPLEGGEVRSFPLTEHVVSASAYGDKLYLVAGEAHEQHITVIDAQGETTALYPLPSDGYTWRAEPSDFGIYLLSAQEAPEYLDFPIHASIYRLDEENPGEPQKLEIPYWDNEEVNSFSISEQCLIVSYESNLLIYHLESQQVIAEPTNCGRSFTQVLLGPFTENGMSAYGLEFMGDQLFLFDMATHSFSNAADLPNDNAGILCDGGFVYSMDRLTGEMTRVLMTADVGKNYEDELVIVNYYFFDTPRMTSAVELFHEKYPDVKVTFREEFDFRVLSAGMMSGAPGFDLINTSEFDYPTSSQMMFHSGALVDLSQYEEITQWLPEYYDLFEPLTMNGRLFAVPNWIDVMMWKFNEELAEKIGVARPEQGWTWDEFFALADEIKQYNQTADEPICLLADELRIPYIVNQFKSNAVDFSTMTANFEDPKFIELLKQWKQLCDDGLVMDSEIMWEMAEIPENTLFGVDLSGLSYYSLSSQSGENQAWAWPPVFDSDTRYHADVSSLKINSNTSHIDWAVHLLSCYLNPESFREEPSVYWGRMLKDISYYPADATEEYPVSEENEALWKYLMENYVMNADLGDIEDDIRQTLMPQFLNGEMTAEEFARICQRRTNMVLGE